MNARVAATLRRARERLVEGFEPHRRLDQSGPPWRMYDAMREAAKEVIGPSFVATADYYEAMGYLNAQCGRTTAKDRYHAKNVQARDRDEATTPDKVVKAIEQAIRAAGGREK